MDVKVPDFAKGETDMPGSNMRLKCKFCNHEFSGSKSRVVAHLIGDSTKCITTCPTAPIDAQLWARRDRGAFLKRKSGHIDLIDSAEQMITNMQSEPTSGEIDAVNLSVEVPNPKDTFDEQTCTNSELRLYFF